VEINDIESDGGDLRNENGMKNMYRDTNYNSKIFLYSLFVNCCF
jgi:hypothetical protein